MNRDELERLLYSYPFLKAENKNIELEIERMEIQGIKSITYDFKPKSSNKSSTVEVEVINREEKVEELNLKKKQNKIFIDKVENSLEVLNKNEKEVIEKIYFKKMKSKDVALDMYLTYIYVSVLKKQALEKILKIIK